MKTPLSDCPNQPIWKQYAPRRYGKKIRNFQGKLFKEHPWLSFQLEENRTICWACQKFMNERNFSFRDWKKPERLNKHAKSKCHTMAMTKWIVSKNLDSVESVIDLLDSHHKDNVKANRQYMKIIIESLVFTAQQNIAQEVTSQRYLMSTEVTLSSCCTFEVKIFLVSKTNWKISLRSTVSGHHL